VFGDLIDNERFVDAYVRVLGLLHSHGAVTALEAVMAGERELIRS
jgi:mannitol 2-dehydrogenase